MSRTSLVALLAATAHGADPADLRLNQIQVIGSHNSYHVAPAPSVMDLIAVTGKARAESLDYTHRPLPEQFGTLGIRQIELDIYADPKGELFASPAARAMVKNNGKDAGPDPNVGGVLDKPGFKVLHLPDVDYLSTVPTFTAGLQQIRDWSKAHPKHVPIMVLVELKEDVLPLMPTKVLPFDKNRLDDVDAEIQAVFKSDDLVTPDMVRGDATSLRKAIQKRGWPRLDAVRGKTLFCLDNTGKLAELYLEGHPALKNRVMFAPVDVKNAAAAFFKVNDPIKDFDRIRTLVAAGFLVRTRADEGTLNARKNDTVRRDQALASGAQFVSTDYSEARNAWSAYRVRLPGGAAVNLAEIADGAEIGWRVADDRWEGQVAFARRSDLAAGGDAHRIGVDQQRHHHGDIKGRLATQLAGIMLVQRRQIQLGDDVQQEKHQVVFRKSIARRHRLLAALVSVPRAVHLVSIVHDRAPEFRRDPRSRTNTDRIAELTRPAQDQSTIALSVAELSDRLLGRTGLAWHNRNWGHQTAIGTEFPSRRARCIQFLAQLVGLPVQLGKLRLRIGDRVFQLAELLRGRVPCQTGDQAQDQHSPPTLHQQSPESIHLPHSSELLRCGCPADPQQPGQKRRIRQNSQRELEHRQHDDDQIQPPCLGISEWPARGRHFDHEFEGERHPDGTHAYV
jgi:Phosphoinositide phospholipase C, Ca2+-dependent